MNLPSNIPNLRRVKKAKIIEDLGYDASSYTKIITSKKQRKQQNQLLQKKKNKQTKDSKVCMKIFHEFKSAFKFYNEFPLFNKIDKNIKNNYYTNYADCANDIRKTFTNYFINYYNNIEKYNKLFSLSETFEKIYLDYDNKIFTKESKNLIEIKKRLVKLKKELRDTYYTASLPNGTNSHSSSNNYQVNKLKFPVNGDITYNSKSQKNTRKFKLDLANKIRNLNPEQKKGIINLLPKSHFDSNNNHDGIMQIDVNKMHFNQLKELDRYVNQCLNGCDDNINDSSLLHNCNGDVIVEHSETGKSQEDKEADILEELSDSLSSDGDDDSSEMSD